RNNTHHTIIPATPTRPQPRRPALVLRAVHRSRSGGHRVFGLCVVVPPTDGASGPPAAGGRCLRDSTVRPAPAEERPARRRIAAGPAAARGVSRRAPARSAPPGPPGAAALPPPA